MKSGFASRPQAIKNRWRLKKTLSRPTDIRPIESVDMRYIWAAYTKGALASMGEKYADGKMPSEDFETQFGIEILTNYHAAWTLFADNGNGLIPIGLVLGFYSHHNPEFSPFMIVGDMIWFPWATTRNRVETAVKFFHEIRREIQMVEYARKEHQKFFDMICAHAVLRRAGTSYVVYPGEATAIYETRKS